MVASGGTFATDSGSPYQGTYTQSVFSFIAIKGADGFPFDQAVVQEEVLETAGVDGRRWRTVNLQHEPRTFESISDYTSFDLAVTDAKKMLAAKGRLGSLSVNTSAKSYFFKDVHVVAVSPIVSPGAAVGGNAKSGSAATVRATWVVFFTNFTESANS